jgi:uncharacterized SAM-binding protein YcdF (DUF218 family)
MIQHKNTITPEFVKLVSPNLPVIPARIAILFGNQKRKIVQEMALFAAQLYAQGKVKKIIVTGGVTFDDQKDHWTEAEYARRILLSRGVCGKHILFDNKSTNSLENVTNAKRLLLQSEGIIRQEPVLCMGREYATRRFIMTMAKNWPEALATFKGFEFFDRPKSEWHLCSDISRILRSDFQKWREYKDRGHLKPVDFKIRKARLLAHNKPLKIK